MPTLEIPAPGTSNARSARRLGFEFDCECHVADNLQGTPGVKGPDGKPLPEVTVDCTDHSNDQVKTDLCGHVVHPDCQLHIGWHPGKTVDVAQPHWGGFTDGTVPAEHADAHAAWMKAHP